MTRNIFSQSEAKIFEYDLDPKIAEGANKARSSWTYTPVSKTNTKTNAVATFYYTGKRNIKNFALLKVFRAYFFANSKLQKEGRVVDIFVDEFWRKSLGLTITIWLNNDTDIPSAVDAEINAEIIALGVIIEALQAADLSKQFDSLKVANLAYRDNFKEYRQTLYEEFRSGKPEWSW